jgi:hypothetical protein
MITETSAGTEGDKWLSTDSFGTAENFYLAYAGRGKYILYLSDVKQIKGVTLQQAHKILQNWEDWKGLRVSIGAWMQVLTDSWISSRLAR